MGSKNMMTEKLHKKRKRCGIMKHDFDSSDGDQKCIPYSLTWSIGEGEEESKT